MLKKISKVVLVFAMSFAFCFSGITGQKKEAQAASGSSTYSILRSYMVYGSYGSNGHLATNYWSCAGWVSRVLYTAGMAGELGGYVPDFTGYADAAASGLEDFMKDDPHFSLVTTFNNGDADEASERLVAQFNSGEVQPGDIIIYYRSNGRYDNSVGRQHAAIILAERYNGTVSNNNNYRPNLWGSGHFMGHPTVAHSLNYNYGVEFYTPVDGLLYSGDATGYAIYRLNVGNISKNTLLAVSGEMEEKEQVVNADSYEAVKGTDVVKANVNGTSGWYYSENGTVNTDYTGFAKNENGWWYLENGKVDFDKAGVIKGSLGSESGWWYVKGGKVQFTNTVAKNQYGWWRIKNGKVDFSFTGLAQNEYGWWYCRGGKVDFSYTGVAKNDYGWWYVKNGKVQFTDTVAKNQYGWWCCQNGKVNFDYTGFAQNEYGWWYCRNGKVDFSVSGSVYGKGNGYYGYYTVHGGKVVE